MPSAHSKHYVNRIPWIGFKNDTGMKIPPFSCIQAKNWIMPDPSAKDATVDSPQITAAQPTDPINPWALYVTDAVEVAAGAYGQCARPDGFPMLAKLAGTAGGGSDNPFRFVGPQTATWTLTRDAPGFLLLAAPQSGYGLVLCSKGPYRGNLPVSATTTGAVSVTTFIEPWNGTGTAPVSTVTVPCQNPYSNVDTTVANQNLRCTFDWVQGNWELISFDPCPPS